MANNLIQIKRSTSTATPASLSAGELAYSNTTQVLYIGSTDGATVVPIAGQRVPGTLTANQALVANSTSGINKVFAANVQVNFIEANGSGNTGTAGFILFSGGSSSNVYWGSTGSISVNTAAQYNWTNTHTWFANLVINAAAITWVGNTTTSPTVSIANTGVIQTGNSSVTASPQVIVSNSSGTATINTNVIGLGSTGTGTGGLIANVTTVFLGNNTVNAFLNTIGLNVNAVTIANTTGVYTGVVNAASHTVGTSTIANSTGVYTGTVNAASHTVGTSTIANSTGVYTGVVNGSSISVGTSTIANSTGVYTGIVNATTLQTGTSFIANSSNVVFTGSSVSATGADLLIRNATVSGNLIVSGTVVSVNVQTLIVNDNIIELGDNNITTDVVDTGWFSPAGNSTSIWYSGMVRLSGSGGSTNSAPVFWLFGSNTNPNTATTIDTTSNTATGYLKSYLIPYGTGGAFVANTTVVNITANSTVSSAIVANSITLTTALSAIYGGTGQTSYATGDLLYASSTTALSKLSVPGSAANGQVLQITNNLPAYGTLDGGTF